METKKEKIAPKGRIPRGKKEIAFFDLPQLEEHADNMYGENWDFKLDFDRMELIVEGEVKQVARVPEYNNFSDSNTGTMMQKWRGAITTIQRLMLELHFRCNLAETIAETYLAEVSTPAITKPTPSAPTPTVSKPTVTTPATPTPTPSAPPSADKKIAVGTPIWNEIRSGAKTLDQAKADGYTIIPQLEKLLISQTK